MTDVLSTDLVAPPQRAAYWRELVCQTFVQAHCETPAGDTFRGSLLTAGFERTEVSRLDAGPQRIARRPVDIARVMKPRYYLCCHTQGHGRYRERGEDQLIGPGEMVLLDNCEPYSAEYREPVSAMILHLPHDLLRERVRQPERLLGRRLPGGSGWSQVMLDFLRSCLARADALPAEQRTTLAGMALDLAGGALAEVARDPPDPDATARALLLRLKQQMQRRLGDPGLDPERLAASCGISVRQLGRLFQRDGDSFGRYLLRLRIEACRQALEDPSLASRRIGDLALDRGFNNVAHFSRVFRAAVGCTPGEYRSAALTRRAD